jgi:hypothetical protein
MSGTTTTTTAAPSWLTYKTGVRVINGLTTVQDIITPLDLQGLQLTLNFFTSVLVHHLTVRGAWDAFPLLQHQHQHQHHNPCLTCEEINLGASRASHLPFFCRLLQSATAHNLLEQHEGGGGKCFTLTPLGARFRRGGPLHALALWHDGWLMRVYFDGLAKGLETGEVPFKAAHNDTFWGFLGRPEETARRRLFDNYLSGLTARAAAPLSEALQQALVDEDKGGKEMGSIEGGLHGHPMGRYVCDVGGGSVSSPLLVSFLMRYPGMRGIVYDLPEASHDQDMLLLAEEEEEEGGGVGGGGDSKVLTSKADARRRIKRVIGSFLTEGEMAYKLGGGGVEGGGRGCDLMLLKHVLHDWGDEDCLTILTNVRDAMLASSVGAGGGSIKKKRLAIYESLVGAGPVNDTPRTPWQEDGHGSGSGSGSGSSSVGGGSGVPPTGAMKNPLYDRLVAGMDLTMLSMLGEAKERTEGEFRALFAKAGFRLLKIVPTKTPLVVMLLEVAV